MADEATEQNQSEQVETTGDDIEKMKAALHKANEEAKTYRLRVKELEPLATKAQELEEASKTELEKAVEQARREAATETEQRFATERLKDRLRVAAASVLNDPEDAVRLVDLDGIDPQDPKLTDLLTERVGSLVEAKPYLAKTAAVQSSGSADATSRPTAGGNHISVGAAIKAMRGT